MTCLLNRQTRIWLLLVALLALAVPGAARAAETDIDIQQFTVAPDTTQAGGHPNVNIKMRFCNSGNPITNITGTGTTADPLIVVTQNPTGIGGPKSSVRLVGIRGIPNLNAASGWNVTPVAGQPNQIQVNTGGSAIPGTYQGGGEVLLPFTFSCTSTQLASFLKDFTLHFPPGFLGNPTAVTPCATNLWLIGACPPSSQIGSAVVDVVPQGPEILVPTDVYVIDTLGLEPARLGTEVLVGNPQGPFPNTITLRSANDDYGINAAQVNIPKDLGGNIGTIRQIEIYLCSRAPCNEQLRGDPTTTVPLAGARPFFVNPTSCQPATTVLEARSWLHGDPSQPGTTKTASSTFTPTGCGNVPFDAAVDVAPTETSEAGKASAQRVAIDYCAFGHSPGTCVNGHDYADDPIWQAALRNADVTLPKGLTLSPGGGVGLQACTFDEFGVDPSTGKQLTNEPPTCPEGAQIGTIKVETPVLPNPLAGKVFFGPVTAPGRPTVANPWKLFLYIEGAGIRVKLVGNVDVSPEGQVHNRFESQPQVPFSRLEINLRGGSRSILANPDDCDNPHNGSVTLDGWNGKSKVSTPHVTTTGCPPTKPFAPVVESAGSNPEQAGANTTSHIALTRGDGEDDIKNIKLSLPAGAVGSLAAVPQCSINLARAGNCPVGTKIGTVNTTVGTGDSLLTTSGGLYLAEPSVPGDAATLALTVPAKVGPIDLGQVVVLNRVVLRPSDSGVDAITSDVPNILEGVPLHVRRIEINVDRPGFFINPTGCEPRPLTVTFTGYTGAQSTSTTMLNAKGCENLSFAPKLRMIAGARGQNAQLSHPPLKAIVTQGAGEANIKTAKVVLPDLLRPNTVPFNLPGGLCSDTEFAQGACPPLSLVGSARVITPVLPFQLAGPVYVVQEIGSILPKLYVVLRGEGLEVVLRARNSFQGIKTVNTFENLPDVPQAYFELNIKGGPNGILNNFYDACGVAKIHRKIDYTFMGQNGKQETKTTYLQQDGCVTTSSLGASIASKTIKVSRKGIAKVKVRCRASKSCKGKLTVGGKGVKASHKFSIGAKKAKSVKLKFSKKEVRKIFRKHRVKGKATAKVGGKSAKRSVTLVPKKK